MRRNAGWIMLEAILLGLPATVVAALLLFLLLMLSISHYPVDPVESIKVIFSIILVLITLRQFWVLAIQTSRERRYRFGWWFWLALLGMVMGVRMLWFVIFDQFPVATVLLFCPLFLCAMHFILLQWRRRQVNRPAASLSASTIPDSVLDMTILKKHADTENKDPHFSCDRESPQGP